MPLWTPVNTTTALWLDAADAGTLYDATSGGSLVATGSVVARWEDKSGNARHVTQGTSGARPTYISAGLGGKNCLDFDGGDFLANASGITSGTYTGQFNVYWVATRDTSGGGPILTERSSSLVATSLWFSIGGLYYLSSDGSNAASNHTIGATDFGKLSTSGGLVSHFHSPGSRDLLWINGASTAVTAGTASNITGNAGFRIGRREGASSDYWDGKICEIVVVTSSQTVLGRQQIEGYMAHKWGFTGSLPADHPYKNNPPLAGGLEAVVASHMAVLGA